MQFQQFVACRADTGAALPYATATVYLANTSTLAALFNATGGSIGNPVTAGSTGAVGFAAADGNYQVQITSAGGSYSVPFLAPLQFLSNAANSSIDLFTNLASNAISSAVTSFMTGGYSSAGVGGGRYVADSTANATLAAASPSFCKADSLGRYFRLAPQSGKISISQGGAMGGANNDQPAVQAALTYCKAIGCREMVFDFDTVSIWNTTRTSNASQGATDAFAQDGQSIWVTAPIKFTGLPTQTRIKMLSTTGTSLETGWQNVAGNVWRGSGINLLGGPSAGSPSTYGLTFFAMQDIWLDGGCSYTGVIAAPTPGSPDGNDLTNKGIRLQNTQCDNITLTNCTISGFKGEAAYHAGSTQTVQILKNVKIFGSNQSAFNPSTGVVWADNCDFGQSYIAAECLGGIGGRYTNCRFYQSYQVGVTGGPANGLGANYAYPTRDTTKPPPWIDLIDCDFQSGPTPAGAANSMQLLMGNYLRMLNCRGTDVNFAMNTAITNGACTSSYVDRFEYTIDQMSSQTIFDFYGPPTLTTVVPNGTAPNYIVPTNDLHVNGLDVRRTAFAKAANSFAYAYRFTGYFDQDSCTVSLGDADGIVSVVTAGGTVQGLPLISVNSPTTSQQVGAGRPYGVSVAAMSAGPYALAVVSPRMSLNNTGAAATIAVTMAAPYTAPRNFAHGQKTRIYYDGYSTAATIFTFAKAGTNMRLNATRGMYAAGDWLELEYNMSTGLWHEVGYHAQNARLIGNATWAPGAIASAASATTTVTVTGAALGDVVDAVSIATDQLGCTLAAYVSAANTVTAVLTNNTGASKTPASSNLRVEVTK
jgi:hypothetical protein